MALLQTSSARSILIACSVYFAACGLSATFFPSSWLWVSGLPTTLTNELQLTFGVIGAYLLALAFGAYLASRKPDLHKGVILTLIVGNILDFAVTLRAVVSGLLPILNGTVFLVVTVVWATLLVLARAAKTTEPPF